MLVRYFTIFVCCLSDMVDDAGHSGNVTIGKDLRLRPPRMQRANESK